MHVHTLCVVKSSGWFVFSIDGTDTDRLGRYINDSPRKFANAVTKATVIDTVPHILVFAVQDIPAGTEVRYDYGGGGGLPWRKVEENQHYNVFFAFRWLNSSLEHRADRLKLLI